MRIKVPYRTDNTVVEFEEGRRIAWCHVNRHRWRYELEPVGEGSTLVTETFDGRTALFPPSLLLINALTNNQVAVAKTLVRLKALRRAGSPESRGSTRMTVAVIFTSRRTVDHDDEYARDGRADGRARARAAGLRQHHQRA